MNLGILLVLILIFLTLCAVGSTESKISRKCRPERNKYYDIQKMRCKICKPCEDGQEKDLSQPLNISEEFGALDCYPCMECTEGQYSNYRYTDRKCVACSRNCLEEHRNTLSICSGKQDTQCGDCLPMYYNMMGLCIRCTQKDASRPECEKYNIPLVSESIQVKPKQTASTQPTGYTYENVISHIINHLSVSVLILVIAVCAVAIIGTGVAIYKLCKCCIRCCKDDYNTTSTLGLITSGKAFDSSKTVEYKGLAQNDLDVDSVGVCLEENEKSILLHRSDEYICLTTRFMDKSPDDLFDRLGIDQAIRYQAKEHYPRNMPEFCREVINKWVSQSGEGATLGNLFEHLTNGHYKLICENIVKKINSKGKIEPNDLNFENVV